MGLFDGTGQRSSPREGEGRLHKVLDAGVRSWFVSSITTIIPFPTRGQQTSVSLLGSGGCWIVTCIWAETNIGKVEPRASSFAEFKWKAKPRAAQWGLWHDGMIQRGQTQACGNKLETRNLKANMGRWNRMKKAMVGKAPRATKLYLWGFYGFSKLSRRGQDCQGIQTGSDEVARAGIQL